MFPPQGFPPKVVKVWAPQTKVESKVKLRVFPSPQSGVKGVGKVVLLKNPVWLWFVKKACSRWGKLNPGWWGKKVVCVSSRFRLVSPEV